MRRYAFVLSLYQKGGKRERERKRKKRKGTLFKRSPLLPSPLPLRAPSIYEYVSVEAWKGRCEVSREVPSSRYAIRPLMATLSLLSTPQKAPLHRLSSGQLVRPPSSSPRGLGHGDGQYSASETNRATISVAHRNTRLERER